MPLFEEVTSFPPFLLIVVFIVLVSEAIVSLLFASLPVQGVLARLVLHTLVLIGLISPVLYLPVVRPLVRRMAEYRQMVERMQRFVNAVEQAAEAIVITNREGVIEYVNPAFERVTGYRAEEAVGKTPRILKSGQHPPGFYEKLWETITAGEVFQAVFVNRRKDGELYYEDRMIAPMRDAKGQITHFIATGRNITRRRELEERLNAVYRLGQELTLLHDEAAIIYRALEAAVQVLRCEIAGYASVDETTKTLTYHYRLIQGQVEAVSFSLPLTAREEIGVIAAQSGQIVRTSDVSSDTSFALVPEALSHRAGLCVPMKVGGQVIGVLGVARFEPEPFTAADERLLQTLADQAAVALENARLVAEAQEALEALRRAYGELSREAWAGLLRVRPDLGFRSTEQGVTSAEDVWRPEMEEAIREGKTVQANGTGGDTRLPLAIPIKVRGQVVGVLDTYKPNDAGVWTPEEVTLLETIAEQLGVALESARLFEETRRRAWREQLISQITARIREASDVEGVLRTAAEELGRALNAARSHVALQVPEDSESAGS